MKLTKSELSEACQQYAKKHNYYTRTVRNMTNLFLKAIVEWQAKNAWRAKNR